MGRCLTGTDKLRITRAPEKIPEQPIPAIARPTIKVLELGATAQIKDPTSKSPIVPMKHHFIEK
jgi:hypothetical protein